MRALFMGGCLISVLLMLVSPVLGQTEDFEEGDIIGGDGGIVVEITVEVEKPTVIVTPIRQQPIIEEGILQTPIEAMINEDIRFLKPTPSDVKVLKIEKPQKMLAKER